MVTAMTDLKSAARAECHAARDELIRLSRDIHAHPELAFEEEKAAGWLCDLLDAHGFAVERGICDTPTAFVARAGDGPLHVAICAEYDALPAIGHACGHNIIAASAVGAGIALKKIAAEAGLSLRIIGTPAEERGNDSGKIRLLERGAFEGTDVAMMVHPAPFDVAAPKMIAASMFDVEYTGKEAHASAFPELGINAADALTVAQTAIGLLRQHILPTDRIHGIITKGGDAPNVVPAHTSARYLIRSETIGGLGTVREKVLRCFEAGAVATGSKLAVIGGDKPYAEVRHDPKIAAIYERNAETLGRNFPDLGAMAERATGSTDMGNISLAFPTIHPFMGIDSMPAVNHQPEFAACCITAAADRAILDAAVAMAWTAIELGSGPKETTAAQRRT